MNDSNPIANQSLNRCQRPPVAGTASLPLIAAFVLGGCAASAARAPTPGAAALNEESRVVATIGDDFITLSEVDAEVADELRELEERRYDLRRRALDDMIDRRLATAAATAAGKDLATYMHEEVESKVEGITDEEARRLFDMSRSELPPGSTFEDFQPRILEFLHQKAVQKQADGFYARLRGQAQVEVRDLPRPQRVRVEVMAEGPAKGPSDAAVTIVAFSDFQCPYCSRVAHTVDRVLEAYPEDVRLVFRHFPLQFHPNAQKAAEASLCAFDQNKFWDYHDRLFGSQDRLAVEDLKAHAIAVGLNPEVFDACLDSGQKAQSVAADMAAGREAGVKGTPAFFINGLLISGAQPFEGFKDVIDHELAQR